MENREEGGNGGGRALLWLLLVPMIVLYVPLYNTIEPTLFGFPFFYWFQLAWIFVSMIITAVVYYGTEPR
ncbi:MAG TPA: DUF3311 domain-containing protein [Micropepsaceae bacterium]|jgi:hypothetical protein